MVNKSLTGGRLVSLACLPFEDGKLCRKYRLATGGDVIAEQAETDKASAAAIDLICRAPIIGTISDHPPDGSASD
ncbi:hypothetical protein [Rhizobium azibense]|uniref:hypothetical protein n=1 Tax=Rhizobium azibense TaxID=1136135 RepID=UPI001048B982|nr:hypothetical protein [Rhizobium azibense]